MLVNLFFLIIITTPLYAGKIYLKDGNVEESEKIWESQKYVHFILKGTQGVEIRLSREIVERIEHNDGKIVSQKKKSAEAALETDSRISPTAQPNSDEKSLDITGGRTDQTNITAPAISHDQKLALLKTNRGVSFYDPRRDQRYWARHDARFNGLNQALETLARQYDRSIAWVETHMGEENDLAEIHQKLIDQVYREAMGDKLTQKDPPIHNEPQDPGMPTITPSKEASAEQLMAPVEEVKVGGIQFYDPRREKKYWVSTTEHHHSLKAAIESLANLYHVSPDWIANHMGDTNALDAIHANIQHSLVQKE